MDLVVVGTGYVGLVTGVCFAEMGNNVTCVDIDEGKINRLIKGVLPIYEPGIEPLIESNYKAGRLQFTTSLEDAMQKANVYFIAVGTPNGEDGSADLKHVLAVARKIGQHMHHDYNVVVDKSTVPVGTADKVGEVIKTELEKRGVNYDFDVVSNPEFLKEGAAIDDFMGPERVIIGSNNDRATHIIRELYAPFTRNHERTMVMGVRDAEMTKYAANAMLATKISFMNEVANLCESFDVDVENVRLGIGADQRIGYHFIYPGCGYGGSCFPKDVKALVHMAEKVGIEPIVLRAIEARNNQQKHRLFEKIQKYFGDRLQGLTFGLWGLAFKPGTDDIREAPSLVLINELVSAGAKVCAYDPVAQENARAELPASWVEDGTVSFAEQQYDALKACDAMVLVTEWKPFRNPDFEAMRRLMKKPIIFDGRNIYDPKHLASEGFSYIAIGRGNTIP